MKYVGIHVRRTSKNTPIHVAGIKLMNIYLYLKQERFKLEVGVNLKNQHILVGTSYKVYILYMSYES